MLCDEGRQDVICCPECGEELWFMDVIYTYDGGDEVAGCSRCLARWDDFMQACRCPVCGSHVEAGGARYTHEASGEVVACPECLRAREPEGWVHGLLNVWGTA